MSFARLHGERRFQQSAQIQPGGTGGGVVRQRPVLTESGIKDFQFDGLVGHDMPGP